MLLILYVLNEIRREVANGAQELEQSKRETEMIVSGWDRMLWAIAKRRGTEEALKNHYLTKDY
jgi:hypothetical protein